MYFRHILFWISFSYIGGWQHKQRLSLIYPRFFKCNPLSPLKYKSYQQNLPFLADSEEGISPESSDDNRMANVGLVVLDEVHYLGSPDRGSVWEEVIISCHKDIAFLCMSATVSNPEDLGGWITKVRRFEFLRIPSHSEKLTLIIKLWPGLIQGFIRTCL